MTALSRLTAMGQFINNKWLQVGAPIYFTLVFLVFLTSCKGQEKTHLRNIEVTSSDNEHANSATPWKDPFFFVDGQLCQHVRKIYQDKTGDLWFGTNVYGLMHFDGDTLVYYDENDELGQGRITGIVEDEDGFIWFATSGGLTKYNRDYKSIGGTRFTNYIEKDGLLNNEIWSLIQDRNGIFWIGTNAGVSRFDGKTFTNFPIPKASVKDTSTIYGYDRIKCIMEDRDGTIWFGTDGFGICKYDPSEALNSGEKSFTHLTKKDGLPDNNVSDLMEDKNGDIWIATSFGGVSRYDGEIFTNYTENGAISGIEAGAFYTDKYDNIWFAIENNGVYRYNRKAAAVGQAEFVNLYKDAGLVSNGILSIMEDKEGRFWFGGWGGLFRYDGQTFIPVTKYGPWD
jgi:ligand-binding sensor domain-containing protein